MLLQPFIQELLYLRDYVPAIDRPQLNLLQLLDQYRSAYPVVCPGTGGQIVKSYCSHYAAQIPSG